MGVWTPSSEADEKILAAARVRDKWRLINAVPNEGLVQVQTILAAAVQKMKCGCGKEIAAHPFDEARGVAGVTIAWSTGRLRFHVDCLHTMLGTLGTEPDRLALLAQEREERRLASA